MKKTFHLISSSTFAQSSNTRTLNGKNAIYTHTQYHHKYAVYFTRIPKTRRLEVIIYVLVAWILLQQIHRIVLHF